MIPLHQSRCSEFGVSGYFADDNFSGYYSAQWISWKYISQNSNSSAANDEDTRFYQIYHHQQLLVVGTSSTVDKRFTRLNQPEKNIRKSLRTKHYTIHTAKFHGCRRRNTKKLLCGLVDAQFIFCLCFFLLTV